MDAPDDGVAFEIALGRDADRSYPLVEVPFINGVRLTPAVHYARPPACRPLTLDLYRPAPAAPKPPAGFPVLIFIHGGSWARGDARSSRPFKRFPWLLAEIAARGFVVASIEYRLVGEALWPAQGDDVKDAVRFLRRQAAVYDADAERIAVWGVSSGGHLAAAVATGGHGDAAVQAAVAWYGEFDLETVAEQSARVGALSRAGRDVLEWNLLGGMPPELDREYLRSASPAHFVSAATPPLLLLTGENDKTIPFLQSVEMADRMKAAGARADLVVFPGLDHHLAGADENETRAAVRRALDLTLRFVARTPASTERSDR